MTGPLYRVGGFCSRHHWPVPAVMALMGRAAWWMPAWLDRILPRLSIEGGDFFERRDAELAAAAAPGPAKA